ncbi:hypothetical protein A2U01_0056738, partial [Trifolium medium]|nr:hypothetical protein [Trifolium medium]
MNSARGTGRNEGTAPSYKMTPY